MIRKPDLFPDNWIYIHTPEVLVGRIQNFRNWSGAMVPEPGTTCLGLEYFCNEGDWLWNAPDSRLVEIARSEVVKLGFALEADIFDGAVVRQKKAYPVYDPAYRGHLNRLKEYLLRFENLQMVGRNGLHKYNNQDHAMLTALLAVKNILGEQHDVWAVNTEDEYHESIVESGPTAESRCSGRNRPAERLRRVIEDGPDQEHPGAHQAVPVHRQRDQQQPGQRRKRNGQPQAETAAGHAKRTLGPLLATRADQ